MTALIDVSSHTTINLNGSVPERLDAENAAGRVLVVDDTPANVRLLAGILCLAGYGGMGVVYLETALRP